MTLLKILSPVQSDSEVLTVRTPAVGWVWGGECDSAPGSRHHCFAGGSGQRVDVRPGSLHVGEINFIGANVGERDHRTESQGCRLG